MKIFNIEVIYQPINNCWGATLKKGNFILCEVDENLNVVLEKMAEAIRNYQAINIK